MKVYIVWCGLEGEDDRLFKVFSKEEDAEKCAEAERSNDVAEGIEYFYHVTEEEVE